MMNIEMKTSKEHFASCFGEGFDDNIFIGGKATSFYQTRVLLRDIHRQLLHAFSHVMLEVTSYATSTEKEASAGVSEA